MKHEDRVEKRGEVYIVLSESGEELGEFESREAANERLRQIEAAKAAKDSALIAHDTRVTDTSVSQVRRVDYLGPVHTDPSREDGFYADEESTGFLRVDARLTRTGVFKYADREGNEWGELRTPEQVFDAEALRSFELVTVTDDHPDDFVSARNVKDVQVGTVGTDVRQDADFVRASIVITDKEVIRSIKDGKIELSCGYTADVIQDSGTTPDGVPFAARQTNIRGNHVALVSKGRAGSSCKLLVGRGDAFTILTEITPMAEKKTKKVKIGDAEYEVAVEVADALEAEQTSDPEPEPEPTPEPPAPESTNDEIAQLRAKVDSLEADRADESSRVDARVELVGAAREVLGTDVQTRGVSDRALMRAVVLKVRPGLEAKLDANKKAQGYLRASFEQALERHRDGVRNETDTASAIALAHLSGASDPKEDEEFDNDISNFMLGTPGNTGNVAEGGN
jgi:hypothetical protein